MMGDHISESSNEQFSLITRVQISGVLMKKPFGNRHNSNKWSKRFVIVKDGFLLYYSEGEKKLFEKRGNFNVHPKGILPLGGCTVEPISCTAAPYLILICSDEFTCGHVTVATDTEIDQERWVTVLKEASRITWKNTQITEEIVRELEYQGLQLTKEKQGYFDKLQEEIIALQDEINKSEELEKVTVELEKEKNKLQEMIQQFKEEHKKLKKECEETSEALKLVEEDKDRLKDTTDLLQHTIEELAIEKENTIEMLRTKNEENQTLSLTTEELQNALRDIEEQTTLLVQEKTELEQRYMDNQMKAHLLAEERQIFCEQANYLLSSLNDLIAEKEFTESELKEEVIARLVAERKLKVADESLHRLEVTLLNTKNGVSEPLKSQLLPDVKRLKQFFEDIAEESRMNANKPIIMKNAVLARKSYIQKSRFNRLQTVRQEKEKSIADVRHDSTLQRTRSLLLSHKAENKLQTLRRTRSTRTTSRIPRPSSSSKSLSFVTE